jgi:phytoene desaturase
MPEKIAVIGAGIAGLAVAVRLAARGFEVDVMEQNPGPGGKLSEIRHEGFRFDTGPSLFTMPELIEELFEAAGEKAGENFGYSKLSNVCRYFYPDGMVINGYGDPVRFTEELSQKAGEDPAKVRDYLEESRFLFELTYPVFIRKSLHQWRNYFSPDFLKAYRKAWRIKPFTTLHKLHERYFKHRNTISLFDRFATYNGSNPYKTPATMMVIPHLEHNVGAYFPSQGMYSIATALYELALKLGVKFEFDCEVTGILTEGNNSKVSGILTRSDGQRHGYKGIVTDLDIYYVYEKLLKPVKMPKKWFRHERSTSAMIFYWGMRLRSDMLDVHNILFATDYREEFRCLFDRKTFHEDPTVYLFISSKVVNEDAPEGCENWFVMVNTPAVGRQDWGNIVDDLRLKIEDKILNFTGIEVKSHRMFEYILDPAGIERKTGSYMGSLYGNSSNSMFAAFQRHPNFSPIRGLYHVGGSVHPGGGIPLCLASAKIVEDIITRNR